MASTSMFFRLFIGAYESLTSCRTPIGLEDVSTYPALLEHLIVQNGWKEEDIIKLAGGNILRVMEENEKVSRASLCREEMHRSLF